jgi:hypothetical protein
MFTQISSCDSEIIGDAEQVLSLCGVRLDLVASRMMLPVEDAGLQAVEETTGSARVNAPASPIVSLAPRNVQGVDHVTTGIVIPRQLVGVEFRHSQSAVLAKYRPSGRGAPAGAPTVSPGCVSEAARAAEMHIHIDSAAAAATFIELLRIFASDGGSRCVRR